MGLRFPCQLYCLTYRFASYRICFSLEFTDQNRSAHSITKHWLIEYLECTHLTPFRICLHFSNGVKRDGCRSLLTHHQPGSALPFCRFVVSSIVVQYYLTKGKSPQLVWKFSLSSIVVHMYFNGCSKIKGLRLSSCSQRYQPHLEIHLRPIAYEENNWEQFGTTRSRWRKKLFD